MFISDFLNLLALKFNVNHSKFQKLVASMQCKFLSEKKFSKIWGHPKRTLLMFSPKCSIHNINVHLSEFKTVFHPVIEKYNQSVNFI